MSLFIQGHPALQEIERAMQAIGYRDELLKRDYKYEDVIAKHQKIHSIDLAAFAQSQTTYRNACIGVVISNSLKGAPLVAQHRALGAPLVFEISGTTISRWKVTASGEPQFKGHIPYENIANTFNEHKSEWEPESILTAKAVGMVRGSVQLDFYDEELMPFLEGRNFVKLDYLLHEVLNKIIKTHEWGTSTTPNEQDLFPLVFRFIAAKVFRDRKYSGGWSSNDAITALRAIEKHYSTNPEEPSLSTIYRQEVLDEIWRIFITTFNFPNLSEDDLALIFEKTFITPQTRKRLGIHSTPLRVAEYIIRKLPIDKLPKDNRYVLEPFAGHGRFLLAAMRRMRDLLPPYISDIERHQYLKRHLAGIEIEPRSVEICRLALTLADSPNKDGWRLYKEDVFATGTLERELKHSRIVLSNPPFEDFPPSKRKSYSNPALLTQRPAELLRRILSDPPQLLGLVLPRRFESGIAYRQFHRQLAERYDSIELMALPEVFNYSDFTTTLVTASGLRSHNAQLTVTCRKIVEKHERKAFLNYGTVPPSTPISINSSEYLRPDFSLWIPTLARVWNYLKDYPKLESITEMHRGLMWLPASNRRGKKTDKYISDTPKQGYDRGYARAEDHLFQYRIDGKEQFLSLRPEDQSRNAFQYEWGRSKVVCNASRLARWEWRVGAVADQKGLVFSSRFVAFWPFKGISIFALAAILNSPICNAFLYDKESGSLNRLVTFRSLPIPSQEYLGVGGKIDLLSRTLHNQLSRSVTGQANNTLLQLDAEILRAYDLPPNLEYKLLSKFQGVRRPVPFEFDGYYPKDFDAYIPLHELISPEFEDARADRLLQRLVFINDPEVSEAMAMLRGESLDEGLPS